MPEETKWNHDESVRTQLENFVEKYELTHAEIAGKLRVTPTRVTKYLNLNKADRVPEADMPAVQKSAVNFLRHVSRRAALRESLFDNSVTESVASVLRTIRKTGDVGLIHSPGGVGKSSGGELYARDNPSTIFTTARQYACGSHAVEQMVFQEYLDTSGAKYPGNLSRSLWLEKEMRGSEWFIIFDNAQRLHISAFKWAMDFHDATLIPFAFIGNTEVLRTLRANDPEGQLITRIGIVRSVKLKNDAEATAEKLIAQFAPKSDGVLVEAAVNVLASAGNARSLKKQLVLTSMIYEGQRSNKDWLEAFASAGTQLIKPVAYRSMEK